MSRTRKLLMSGLLVGLAGVMSGGGTYAAFFSTRANTGNQFSAGTVYLTDNDAGGALLTMTGANPTSPPVTGCIRVTYSGTLASNVRLYASTTGSLATYLTLTVTRGTSTSPFNGCAGFTADATNYIGAGPGVVYSGLLSSYPTTYTGGIVDPPSGPVAIWTNPQTQAYKFMVSLNNNPAAQGLSSTATFTWEARNL